MASYEELTERAERKGWVLKAHYDNQSKHNFYTMSLMTDKTVMSSGYSYRTLEEVEYAISRLAYQPSKKELAPHKKALSDPAKAEAKRMLLVCPACGKRGGHKKYSWGTTCGRCHQILEQHGKPDPTSYYPE